MKNKSFQVSQTSQNLSSKVNSKAKIEENKNLSYPSKENELNLPKLTVKIELKDLELFPNKPQEQFESKLSQNQPQITSLKKLKATTESMDGEKIEAIPITKPIARSIFKLNAAHAGIAYFIKMNQRVIFI